MANTIPLNAFAWGGNENKNALIPAAGINVLADFSYPTIQNALVHTDYAARRSLYGYDPSLGFWENMKRAAARLPGDASRLYDAMGEGLLYFTPAGIPMSARDAYHAATQPPSGPVPKTWGERISSAANIAGEVALPLTMMAGLSPVMRGMGKTAAARDVDPAGYYSGALEAAKNLPQAKGTPEQMLSMLRKGGAKDAEIDATGLGPFLSGRKSVTRDDLVKFLEENMVVLKEVRRDLLGGEQRQYGSQAMFGREWESLTPEEQTQVVREVTRSIHSPETKWHDYSLDPSNLTYRETVLHLPGKEQPANVSLGPAGWHETGNNRSRAGDVNFQSGHFPEPNITGYLMTSMVKDAQGRKVFNVDQIQSDWGQKLREGGVRDEAKIAKLKERIRDIEDRISLMKAEDRKRFTSLKPTDLYLEKSEPIQQARGEQRLLEAELRTAEAATPGHPLVNTTDQWTNTTLRHALKQAIESGADAISIPSGSTVLSYNQGGDVHGMSEFYGKIVPKNLSNILKKFDPAAARGTYHQQLVTPSGARGEGFTVFPITDKVKQAVMEGQPLFASTGPLTSADAIRTMAASYNDKKKK